MNDSEGGGCGPGVDKLAAMTDGGVGKNAVRALFDPFFNVMSHPVPIETESETV